MKTIENEIREYICLNELAGSEGMILFGGSGDREIPVAELRQSFELNVDLYNRSVSGLSVKNAADIYAVTVAPVHPECVLLHVGEEDVDYFMSAPADFDCDYRRLIGAVRENNKKCRVVIINLKNDNGSEEIKALNRHLRDLSDSERCDYQDIAARRPFNAQATREVTSFVYSMGFVRPVNNRKPVYDIVRILYGYNDAAPVRATAEKRSFAFRGLEGAVSFN